MSRSSGGVYSLPAGNPVVTGTLISSAVQNATMTDIATALTQSIASTGVTTPTADLPMGGFRHTGVAIASAQACYASVTDIQNGTLVTLSAVAGTNTITGTAPFTVAAYAAGQCFRFVAAGANTGAVTLNVSTLGAKAVTKFGATALSSGDIASGAEIEVVYDGTQFQIIGGLQTLKGTAAGTVDLLTGANIASASTINLDSATGNRVHVTGTVTITAVTLTRGPRTVIFDGALTLTHHATNNFLPNNGSNITTAAGDVAVYESDGTTVRCIEYTRASGQPINPNTTSMVLLATVSPTAAANVDALTTFASTYDNYLIIGQGIKPGVDDTALVMRVANAGVVDTGSNYVGSPGQDGSTPVTTALAYAQLTAAVTAAGIGADFVLHVTNCNDATNLKAVLIKSLSQQAATPAFVSWGGATAYIAASAISGVRFYWNGGANFAATGKIRIYAYNNA